MLLFKSSCISARLHQCYWRIMKVGTHEFCNGLGERKGFKLYAWVKIEHIRVKVQERMQCNLYKI